MGASYEFVPMAFGLAGLALTAAFGALPAADRVWQVLPGPFFATVHGHFHLALTAWVMPGVTFLAGALAAGDPAWIGRAGAVVVAGTLAWLAALASVLRRLGWPGSRELDA